MLLKLAGLVPSTSEAMRQYRRRRREVWMAKRSSDKGL
jgi:hypothetical protein